MAAVGTSLLVVLLVAGLAYSNSIGAARHGGPRVGIEIWPGDGAIDIEVWDDGPGVPDTKVERLFDMFVHDGAAPLLTGTVGLGLAVASRITNAIGGRLWYQRLADRSSFVVSLPMADSRSAPRHSRALAEALTE